MEYTELADYPIHSGTVTEWLPAATGDDWRRDPRSLSTNHEAHLAFSSQQGDQAPPCWIGTAFRISGPLDAAAFTETLRLWVGRHEAYRTTARSTQSDSGLTFERHCVAAESVTIDSRRYGRPRGGTEIHDHIEKFFATQISPFIWPHVVITTIEPNISTAEQEWFTVIFAADHSVMDAYTQVFAIAELTEIYRAVESGREPQLPPTASYVDYSVVEREYAAALHADHDDIARWRDYLTAGSATPAVPRFPLPVVGTDGVGAQPNQQASLSLWLLDAAETESFTGNAKQQGGSQTSAILAAAKIALSRLGNSGSTRYLMPMHTRTSLDYAAAAGWFVGLMPVDDAVGDATTFAAAVADTSKALKANKGLVGNPYSRVAELVGLTEAPEFVISFVDGRYLPGAAAWTEHERALRSTMRSDTEVYLWINRAIDGLNLSARFPANEVASASIHAFIAEFSAVLRDVAATGDTSVFLGSLPGLPSTAEEVA
ncbi:condensation domain-containing protein [Gordonia sp. CPCC 205333]|uniref:condensation domain-containing protein n=1 Tax=Gordonia sp. CPCC 205333 TaxID=3140790 RepID=UPI003AF35CA7